MWLLCVLMSEKCKHVTVVLFCEHLQSFSGAGGGRCDQYAGRAACLPVSAPDPGAVDLEKVANVIVDHSLQDRVFSKEAGRMCYAIIQVGERWWLQAWAETRRTALRPREEDERVLSPGSSGGGCESTARP